MKQKLFLTIALLMAVCSFSKAATKEAYAVLSNDGKTLTFRYDANKSNYGENAYALNVEDNNPGWYDWNNPTIEKAVFTASFKDARPTSTYGWFQNQKNLSVIEGISNLNTSEVTNMSDMFYNCIKLTSITLNGFDTSKVENMNDMFGHCESLTSLDLSKFNTSKVTSMNCMFNDCISLIDLDLSNFNTEKVTDMSSMFNYCKSLTSVDLSSFDTSNVTDMSFMFYTCENLTTLDISSFNTSNVTNMSHMFGDCSKLTTIYVGDNWNTDNLQTTSIDPTAENGWAYMFHGCTSLKGEKGTTYNASHVGKEYAHVDGGTSNPGYLSIVVPVEAYAVLSNDGKTLTFYYDNKKDTRTGTVYALNTGYNLPGWYKENDGSAENLFTTVVFTDSFKDARPTTTRYWFANQYLLTTITGIGNLNTSEVTNMSSMFDLCSGLTNLDLSSFDTSNVTDMSYMFFLCSGLTSLDVSKFNTSEVTNMKNMFGGCSGLTSLDVSNFDTSEVKNMSWMFYICSGLTSLDLSSFDTSNVTDMSKMFYYDRSLITIYVGSQWDTSNLSSDGGNHLFLYCSSLIGENGTTYDEDNTGKEYAHIDGVGGKGYLSVGVEAYAVLSSDEKTLTFYYDNKMYSRTGTAYALNTGEYPGWCKSIYGGVESPNKITKVVFTDSFKDARPTTTLGWFAHQKNLVTITGISNLNTSEVTDMYGMFRNCPSLTSIDVSNFDTSKVTNMCSMFLSCTSLSSLDVSSFDTSEVTDMRWMFGNCSSLTTLDLSSFNTSKVKYMSYMFSGDQEMTTIYVESQWDTSNLLDSDNGLNMFSNCTQLVGENGTTYDSNNTGKEYAHIDGVGGKGYLSAKPDNGITTGGVERLNDNGEMINDKAREEWFTIDGRKLSGKPAKKGVYIHNGRAVIN